MSLKSNQCVTGKVRLSYVHLFKPYAQNGGEPKYSTTILVPKSDVASKARLDAAIAAATQQGVSDKWNGVRPAQLAIPVYDGDGTRPSDGAEFGPECKGHWVFTASSKQAPGVVDATLNPLIDQSEVYSGMYARVCVSFFPYNSNGRKGVGAGLDHVQKLEDGEPLGSRTSVSDAFGAQPQGYASPQPYAQQAQGYAQPQSYAPQPPQGYAMPQAPAAPPYPPQGYAPQFQGYAAPQQPQQAIDPITGLPAGSVLGL